MDVLVSFIAGGTVSRANPESTGLNPAWRETIGQLVTGIGWPEGTPTSEIDDLRKGAAAELASLDTVSADSGTYFNEVSSLENVHC
jgi:hypothetical protein